MGSKASKPQAATVTEQPEEASSPETESGVVLAIDFQNKILQDFQSSILKQEWEKRQKLILAKSNERRLGDYQFQEALKERLQHVRQHHAQIQQQLDEKAEALQARFADVAVELQHDAARLREQHLSSSSKQPTGSQPGCLDVRTKLATCYKENASNSKICDDYVEALNVCMQKRLLANP